MVNLTFGEQVKIILSRRGMTIKELAERVEERTGKNMSRQNMTQRLGRDNFQEQDMRLIADILGCSFQLSIMEPAEEPIAEVKPTPIAKPTAIAKTEPDEKPVEAKVQPPTERDITVGELVQLTEPEIEPEPVKEPVKETERGDVGLRGYIQKTGNKRILAVGRNVVREEKKEKEELLVGERNPYTGKEYQTNSVRMHPKRIGYVQVYDQEQHAWTDMTEWAFLGYQERKKKLLGKAYVPPIYLD